MSYEIEAKEAENLHNLVLYAQVNSRFFCSRDSKHSTGYALRIASNFACLCT